jgi:hypothetical protein
VWVVRAILVELLINGNPRMPFCERASILFPRSKDKLLIYTILMGIHRISRINKLDQCLRPQKDNIAFFIQGDAFILSIGLLDIYQYRHKTKVYIFPFGIVPALTLERPFVLFSLQPLPVHASQPCSVLAIIASAGS